MCFCAWVKREPSHSVSTEFLSAFCSVSVSPDVSVFLHCQTLDMPHHSLLFHNASSTCIYVKSIQLFHTSSHLSLPEHEHSPSVETSIVFEIKITSLIQVHLQEHLSALQRASTTARSRPRGVGPKTGGRKASGRAGQTTQRLVVAKRGEGDGSLAILVGVVEG